MKQDAIQQAPASENTIIPAENKPTAFPPEFQTRQAQDIKRFVSEAEILKNVVPVSRRTWGNWKAKGLIPFIRLPGTRRVLYDLESVRAALLRMSRGDGSGAD